MIFSAFDSIDYAGVPMTDVFRNYKSYINDASKDLVLRDYLIEASDRPEVVSWKLYGDSQYYWVLLMLNNTYDPFHGWIKSQDAVHQSANYQYEKVGGVNQIAYHVNAKNKRFYNLYEDPNNPGHWYDKIDKQKVHLQYKGTLVPVTVIEDQLSENEDKRTIRIIAPNDITRFISSLRRIMGQASK